jgi:hypothetical protein
MFKYKMSVSKGFKYTRKQVQVCYDDLSRWNQPVRMWGLPPSQVLWVWDKLSRVLKLQDKCKVVIWLQHGRSQEVNI